MGGNIDVRHDLQYCEEDLWVDQSVSPAMVGITDFAQDQLGELVWFELPDPGTRITAGESFGEVESTKTVSDLVAPVSGRIVEVNEDLVSDPLLANSDPYGEGWLVKVDVEEGGGGRRLLDPDEYRQRISME